MYTLGPEDKVTMVMAYSQTGMIRGEVVTRENVRVSVWLRMDGAPDFIRVYNANVVSLAGGQARSATYSDMLVPSASLMGFHIAPPAQDQLDYDNTETNRTNAPVSLIMGAFNLKGRIRISEQSDIATTIATGRIHWMSIYDAEITSPLIPQMPAIQAPMLLVRPHMVSFVLG